MSVTGFSHRKPPDRRLHHVLRALLGWLAPRLCLSCDRLIEQGRPFLGLCIRCRSRLKSLSGDRCPGCCRPLRGYKIPPGFRCSTCRARPPTYDRLIALWAFAPPMDAVIHGLKFERLEFLGGALAVELATRLRAEELEADLVTWVPLHWRRQLTRGYNQAERIARPLANHLKLPVKRLLSRPRATPAQTSLGRLERTTNLVGSMRARRTVRLEGQRLLLVDDVMTTGSTLQAASTALKAAGAAEITAVTAARTAGPEEPGARRLVIW